MRRFKCMSSVFLELSVFIVVIDDIFTRLVGNIISFLAFECTPTPRKKKSTNFICGQACDRDDKKTQVRGISIKIIF
jgi:hypothetical protein